MPFNLLLMILLSFTVYAKGTIFETNKKKCATTANITSVHINEEIIFGKKNYVYLQGP